MSGCFPFVPTGCQRSGESLVESTKLKKKEREQAIDIKEEKREKKEKKHKKDKHKRRRGDLGSLENEEHVHKKRKHDSGSVLCGKKSKSKEAGKWTIEQLEKSHNSKLEKKEREQAVDIKEEKREKKEKKHKKDKHKRRRGDRGSLENVEYVHKKRKHDSGSVRCGKKSKSKEAGKWTIEQLEKSLAVLSFVSAELKLEKKGREQVIDIEEEKREKKDKKHKKNKDKSKKHKGKKKKHGSGSVLGGKKSKSKEAGKCIVEQLEKSLAVLSLASKLPLKQKDPGPVPSSSVLPKFVC